jgi:hypothetical protein
MSMRQSIEGIARNATVRDDTANARTYGAPCDAHQLTDR